MIFTRVAPVVAIAEIKHILKVGGNQYIGENANHGHHDKSHTTSIDHH